MKLQTRTEGEVRKHLVLRTWWVGRFLEEAEVSTVDVEVRIQYCVVFVGVLPSVIAQGLPLWTQFQEAIAHQAPEAQVAQCCSVQTSLIDEESPAALVSIANPWEVAGEPVVPESWA